MSRRPAPLYLDCTPRQAFETWLGVALYGMLLCWGLIWLAAHNGEVHLGWPWWIVALFVGLFFADFFSGFVHWATDTWFDERVSCRVVSIAREHHIYPQHIVGYTARDYLGYSCWPTFLVMGPIIAMLTLVLQFSTGVYFAAVISNIVILVMAFGTYAHRLGHTRSKSRFIEILQRYRLLNSLAYHGLHHTGQHDGRYSVINGWADEILDRIGFWRVIENLIHAMTGMEPRRNDKEWLERYRQDPAFMHDPVPSLIALRNEEANSPGKSSSGSKT